MIWLKFLNAAVGTSNAQSTSGLYRLPASVEDQLQSTTFASTSLYKGAPVLHKCANPGCSAKLVYLRQGRLFEVEVQVTGSSEREYYWLCGQCAMDYTLCFDRERSMLAVTSLGPGAHAKVIAIPQSSSKTICALKRVLIRSFSPLSTMGKAAAKPTLSGMEES